MNPVAFYDEVKNDDGDVVVHADFFTRALGTNFEMKLLTKLTISNEKTQFRRRIHKLFSF